MDQLRWLKRGDVITGLHVNFQYIPEFDIQLPDRYIGEGNDIAAQVLHVMAARELAKFTGRMNEYDQMIRDDPFTGSSRFIINLMYPLPVDDDD